MTEASDHGFHIVEDGDRIAFTYFDYRESTQEWFESRELQGGGYTWETLTQAAFELEPSPLAESIYFDSEGDAFHAVVQSKAAAELLKATVERLVNDMAFRERCIVRAEAGGYIE